MRSPREGLPALTGLRFLAAFHVVVFHTTFLAVLAWPSPVQRFIGAGPAAVSLFFVLSGFILTYNYLEGDGVVERRGFWASRIARIYPVYALCLVLSWYAFVHAGFAVSRVVAVSVTSVSLTQAWGPSTACAWNCPGWSLSAELFFYLLFPFLLPLVARLNPRKLVPLVGACWAMAVLPSLAVLLVGFAPGPTAIFWDHVMAYNPLVHLPEFVAGIALGRVFLLARQRGAARTPGWVAPSALGALVVAYAFVPSGIGPLVRNGLLLPLVCALVYALGDGQGWLARVLASRVGTLLGESSYALYLIHTPIALWFLYFGIDLHHSVAIQGAYYAFAVLVSIVVYREVEEPSRAVTRRFLLRVGRRRQTIARRPGSPA